METKMHILQATKSTCNYERLYEENPPPNSSFFSQAYLHSSTSFGLLTSLLCSRHKFQGLSLSDYDYEEILGSSHHHSLSSNHLTMLCLSYILTESSREKTLLF